MAAVANLGAPPVLVHSQKIRMLRDEPGGWTGCRSAQHRCNSGSCQLADHPFKPVEVEVVRRGSKASIVIRDFGPGIADKDKPLVFERFHRLAGGEQSGTGLGMSIAADVAAHCRALLVLKDTIPNGLTVEIQFPYKTWQEAE